MSAHGLPGVLPASLPVLDLPELLINLGLSGVLAWSLGLHYRHFGSSLASRESFSKIFPFVALTTTLLITIVKSSLAMSLGLVGALSIIRFRTPVKEPEELAYLFLAITIGLGMGASLRVATATAAGLIVALVTTVQLRSRAKAPRNLFLNLGVEVADGEPSSMALVPLHDILRKHCRHVDLRRMDSERERLELTFFVDVEHVSALSGLATDLELNYPTIRVTMLDQGRAPSL